MRRGLLFLRQRHTSAPLRVPVSQRANGPIQGVRPEGLDPRLVGCCATRWVLEDGVIAGRRCVRPAEHPGRHRYQILVEVAGLVAETEIDQIDEEWARLDREWRRSHDP